MEESARPALPSDLEALSSLAVAARNELQDKKGGDVADRLDPHRDDPGARMASALEDPGTVVLVGALDEAVVGYGVMEIGTAPDGTVHAVVEEVYVDPPARSVGVGEALLDGLLAVARERGALAIQSVALPGDRATKNFFETHGMVARAIMVHRWLDGR